MNYNEIQQMMGEDKEVWADIPDYDGYYQVSTHGRVRSWKNRNGKSKKKMVQPHVLSLGNCNGRHNCILSLNKQKTTYLVARLVATVFIPNLNNLPQIDHKDRDPKNDHISNLRWCSNSQNNLNVKLNRRNTSGHKGIFYNRHEKKWSAGYSVNGKEVRKLFKSRDEAVAHRQKMIEKYYDKDFYKPT
jgi:hypothetical protein